MCFLSLFVWFLAIFIKQDSSSGRMFIWKTSSGIIKDNPIYGIGYDNFATVYPNYQALMYETGKMSDKDLYVADNTKMALNEYIQTTAELGAIGLILLVSIIITYLYYGKREMPVYLCICIGMLFSYILHSAIIVYILILVLSLNRVPPLFKLNWTSSAIILSVLMLFSMHSINICMHKFNTTKKVRLLWIQSPDKLNEFYETNRKYLCDNHQLLFKLAEYNYNHGNTTQALLLLRQLDYIITRNDIELLKGRCYTKKGCFEMAEKHLLLSIAICPNRFINRYELFKLYKESNMKLKAIEVANEIYDMNEKIPSIHTMVIKSEISDYLKNERADILKHGLQINDP
jgi:hypothetical protein